MSETIEPLIHNSQDTSHAVILFDGVCNLCTWSVRFIIERDPTAYFRFASLQSPGGQRLAATYAVDTRTIDSFVLIENNECYSSSDAALRVTRHLSGWWSGLIIFKVVPRSIRDWLYTIIANNRYHWFGQRAECMLPSPELKQRFL